MTAERTLDSRRIYEGKVINLRIDTVRLPSGNTTRREIVEHRGCVVIVPVDSRNDVLLVRQYRHAVGKVLLELPAGGIEPGEDPLEGARRELEEETGHAAGKWRKLAGFYSTPGFTTEYMHLYLATDLVAGKLKTEPDENIELAPTPLLKTPDLIETGEIADAKSIAGLLLAMRKLLGRC